MANIFDALMGARLGAAATPPPQPEELGLGGVKKGIEQIQAGFMQGMAPRIGRDVGEALGREYAPTEYRLGLAKDFGTKAEQDLVDEYRRVKPLIEKGVDEKGMPLTEIDKTNWRDLVKKVQSPQYLSSKTELEGARNYRLKATPTPPAEEGRNAKFLSDWKLWYDTSFKDVFSAQIKNLDIEVAKRQRMLGVEPDVSSTLGDWIIRMKDSKGNFLPGGAENVKNFGVAAIQDITDPKILSPFILDVFEKAKMDLESRGRLLAETSAEMKKNKGNKIEAIKTILNKSAYKEFSTPEELEAINKGDIKKAIGVMGRIKHDAIYEVRDLSNATKIASYVSKQILSSPDTDSGKNSLLAMLAMRDASSEDRLGAQNAVENYVNKVAVPILSEMLADEDFLRKGIKKYTGEKPWQSYLSAYKKIGGIHGGDILNNFSSYFPELPLTDEDKTVMNQNTKRGLFESVFNIYPSRIPTVKK